MNHTRLLLVLLLLALSAAAAQAASATPPDAATAVVERQLIKPLADKEGRQSRFSRVYVPPQTRRVRVLDKQEATDGRGAAFLPFAIDERAAVVGRRAADDERGWRKDAILGCVYPARDEVFIKRGDKFFGATLLLGKKTPAADAAVCRPAVAAVPRATARPLATLASTR